MVFEHRYAYDSQWATITSIAEMHVTAPHVRYAQDCLIFGTAARRAGVANCVSSLRRRLRSRISP